MSTSICFVVISHSEPELLKRLLSALDRTYRDPPIVVHHDFSQCPLPDDALKWAAKLQFVRPHVRTSWAHISIVTAFLAGLDQLYRNHAPDWFVLLSGSDYPARPGSTVVNELVAGDFDLYMDYQLVERSPREIQSDADEISYLGTDSLSWRSMAYDRYVARSYRYPSLTKRLRPTHRRLILRNEMLLGLFNPFSSKLRCHAGDHWFTGNAAVAQKLIRSQRDFPKLFQYYATRFCPEESVYHTILANSPDLRIKKDNKRFTDWSLRNNHPKTLTRLHLNEIIRGGSHFARKVTITESRSLLDALDKIIS
jgi:hypothetical protein